MGVHLGLWLRFGEGVPREAAEAHARAALRGAGWERDDDATPDAIPLVCATAYLAWRHPRPRRPTREYLEVDLHKPGRRFFTDPMAQDDEVEDARRRAWADDVPLWRRRQAREYLEAREAENRERRGSMLVALFEPLLDGGGLESAHFWFDDAPRTVQASAVSLFRDREVLTRLAGGGSWSESDWATLLRRDEVLPLGDALVVGPPRGFFPLERYAGAAWYEAAGLEELL